MFGSDLMGVRWKSSDLHNKLLYAGLFCTRKQKHHLHMHISILLNGSFNCFSKDYIEQDGFLTYLFPHKLLSPCPSGI